MPVPETLIALSALGPALFKASLPAGALSTSGIAAAPAASAPSAGFAAVSAAAGGGGATCCSIKSLGAALLLTKKGGATAVAKAGSSLVSFTKAAAPAAGGSAAGVPAVTLTAPTATSAGTPPSTGGAFSSVSPPHAAGSAPLHHISPFHNHARAAGAERIIQSPGTSTAPAGDLPRQHVPHNPTGAVGGKPKVRGPGQSIDVRRPLHQEASRGAGETSSTRQHLHGRTPQSNRAGRPYGADSRQGARRELKAEARRVGDASTTPASAADPTAVSPSSATAAAEQPGGQQPAGRLAGAGGNEATVISTLVGVALLRWALSSICFTKNSSQGEASAVGEGVATPLTPSQKNDCLKARARDSVKPGVVNGEPCQWTGRRVERWKRDEDIFVIENKVDSKRPDSLSMLPEKTSALPQPLGTPVLQKPLVLEVCLSEGEDDGLVTGHGESLDTVQHLSSILPDTEVDRDAEHVWPWQVGEESKERGMADTNCFGEGSGKRTVIAPHNGLEGGSDTTIASSRKPDENLATREGLNARQPSVGWKDALRRQGRSCGRVAAFL